MDKNTKRKLGKFFMFVLAVILVSLISIMSTIAYLSDTDGEEVHTFTLGEGVDVELIQDTAEPEEFYPEKEYPEKHASVKIPDTAMEYEYIGVKVQFFTEVETTIKDQQALQFKKTSYSDFSKEYGTIISYSKEASEPAITSETDSKSNTETMDLETRIGWKEYEDSNGKKSRDSADGTIYLYYGVKQDGNQKPITGDTLTKVKHDSEWMLFDSIKVNKNCDQKYSVPLPEGSEIQLYNQSEGNEEPVLYTTRVIRNDQLKGFRIVVTAYAVQGDINPDEAEQAIISLIKKN